MKKLSIKSIISPLFIIFLILIMNFGNILQFVIYCLVVTIHELAHFIVSKKLGYSLNNVYIMPYGICLNYRDNIVSSSDETKIALAGPCVNFILCFFCVALWWMFPITYYYLDYFCFCNLVLGLFNLLPCFPLDGGRVFVAQLSKKYDREHIYKFSVVLNYMVSLGLLILFVTSIFKDINYSYIIIAIFLFGGCINPNKLSSYGYFTLSCNRDDLLKHGANIKMFAVSSDVPLYKIISKFSKYKYNIVYVVLGKGGIKVLSESNISALALKYSPTICLNQIMH